VNQSIAAERESFEGLFGLMNDGRRNGRMFILVGSIRKFDSTDEGDDWIRVFMDLDMGKLCMAFEGMYHVFLLEFIGFAHSLYQQTIRSQDSGIISYRIVKFLQFYII
jgi:hypothetical protein